MKEWSTIYLIFINKLCMIYVTMNWIEWWSFYSACYIKTKTSITISMTTAAAAVAAAVRRTKHEYKWINTPRIYKIHQYTVHVSHKLLSAAHDTTNYIQNKCDRRRTAQQQHTTNNIIITAISITRRALYSTSFLEPAVLLVVLRIGRVPWFVCDCNCDCNWFSS